MNSQVPLPYYDKALDITFTECNVGGAPIYIDKTLGIGFGTGVGMYCDPFKTYEVWFVAANRRIPLSYYALSYEDDPISNVSPEMLLAMIRQISNALTIDTIANNGLGL